MYVSLLLFGIFKGFFHGCVACPCFARKLRVSSFPSNQVNWFNANQGSWSSSVIRHQPTYQNQSMYFSAAVELGDTSHPLGNTISKANKNILQVGGLQQWGCIIDKDQKHVFFSYIVERVRNQSEHF